MTEKEPKQNNDDEGFFDFEANIRARGNVRQPKWKRLVPDLENFCGKTAAMAYVKGLEGKKFNPKMLKPIEISIVLTGNKEVQRLNNQYRGKNMPTNVLTFVNEDINDDMFDEILLGDIIIALQVTEKEALQQNKHFDHHLAHLISHGVLHLLGYDHEISDNDAEKMEELEIKIMYELGFPISLCMLKKRNLKC